MRYLRSYVTNPKDCAPLRVAQRGGGASNQTNETHRSRALFAGIRCSSCAASKDCLARFSMDVPKPFPLAPLMSRWKKSRLVTLGLDRSMSPQMDKGLLRTPSSIWSLELDLFFQFCRVSGMFRWNIGDDWPEEGMRLSAERHCGSSRLRRRSCIAELCEGVTGGLPSSCACNTYNHSDLAFPVVGNRLRYHVEIVACPTYFAEPARSSSETGRSCFVLAVLVDARVYAVV